MAEDQLLEDSKQSFSDQLIDFGETAAATGIAAAVLYRTGAGRYIAKRARKYGKSVRKSINEISKLDYDHMNRNSLEDAFNTIKENLKNPDNDGKISISNRPGTTVEALAQSFKAMLEGNRARSVMTYQDRVVAPIMQEAVKMASQLPNATKAELYHIRNFSESIALKLRNYQGTDNFATKDIIRQHAINPRVENILQKTLKYAVSVSSEFNKNRPKDKFSGEDVGNMLSKMLANTKKLASINGSAAKKSKMDLLLGDRGVTILELLENPDKFNDFFIAYIDKDGTQKNASFQKVLKKYHKNLEGEEKKSFEQLYLDPYIRTDGREFYSFSGAANLKHKAMSIAAATMPGKILKLRDIEMSNMIPSLIHIERGAIELALANFEKKHGFENSDGKHINNDYFRILDTIYQYDYNSNKLISLEEIDPVEKRLAHANVISTRYGGMANLHREIGGLNPERTEKNPLFKLFGLGGSTDENIWEYFNGLKERDNNYVPNILEDIAKDNKKLDITERYDRLLHVNTFLESHTEGFSDSQLAAINKISDNLSPQSKIILNILSGNKTTEELIQAASEEIMYNETNKGGQTYLNHRLTSLIGNYHRDQWKALQSIKLDEDITGAWDSKSNVGLDFADQLRKELSRELILREAHITDENVNQIELIKDFLESTDMSAENLEKAKQFSYASILDANSNSIFTGAGRMRLDNIDDVSIYEAIETYEKRLGKKGATEIEQDFQKSISNIIKDNHGGKYLHSTPRDRSLDKPAEYIQSDYSFIPKSVGPIELIEAINQGIKEQSIERPKDTFIQFFKQFAAGRENMDEASLAMRIPYFFLHRLGADDIPSFLRFSNEETGSTFGLTKGLIKRIAPIAIGATYLEWLDDTVGAISGTRASAGIVNGLDYMDIGVREILDITGIGGFLDTQTYVNPIAQYWFGKDGYRNADKQRGYYANGYEEVRRGRWWSFGSVNEFRGSQIEYYRPNLTRRLNSDYYNKSLYSSYWDKWGHSLLPTPAVPFSPLVYLLDPYYLEEEHYNDRPYTVTGTMFARDTPWGIILNPTIGELIKPIKKMHEDRMYGDTDVEAIIYSINKRIRDIADDNHAYTLMYDHGDINAGEYTGYNSPSMGEYSFKIGKTANERMQEQRAASVGGIDITNRTAMFSPTVLQENSVWNSTPVNLLGQTNRSIREAAISDERGGVLITAKIPYYTIDKVLDDTDINDLINASTGTDMIKEAATSFRLISGIYGYGANRMFGFGEADGRQIADAGDIDSFSRSFWDMSIGGLGGGAAEIGRRFVPEYRRGIRINPLLNTMPDWLPERFRLGDPYASIPSGEARLPGKGYEALNNLHSDAYGTYGAFDRYKILADIAPNSSEFKIWKKIAQKTVKDPTLKEEIQEIQNRVNEQNKSHDFYDYKIIGNSVNYDDAIVSEVNKDGTFRIHGSDELYRIAGIESLSSGAHYDTRDPKQEKATRELLMSHMSPGSSIVIATDNNEYHRHNLDGDNTVNAAVFVDGESLATQLIEEDPATFKRKNSGVTATDVVAIAGTAERTIGAVTELLAHTDLPWFHDKFLRTRSPLESYKAEQVYGTPYQTWSDVMGTYLFPAFERSMSDPFDVVKSTAEYFFLMNYQSKAGIGRWSKVTASLAASLLDRGAFSGGMIAAIIKTNDGTWFKNGQKIGAAISLLGNLYTSTQGSTFGAMASYAQAGWLVGDLLDEGKLDVLKETSWTKKFWRNEESFAKRTKFGMIGAAIGLAASGAFGPSLFNDEEVWKPERVKEKWEIEDYFDRLNYIKFMGLYHKAAREAYDKEGIDIEKVFAEQDAWQKQREEILKASDVNSTDAFETIKRVVRNDLRRLEIEVLGTKDENNHRFTFDNGFSINDLPGVRNGVFHSEELSEEERLFTLNALVTIGEKYNRPGTSRTSDDRDMSQLSKFERIYKTKIPDNYEVHHIVEFSEDGADNPANMIALHPDDHLYITEQQYKFRAGAFEAAQDNARTAIRMGEYGRAAILYKKAAESTMYGLRDNARWTDVIKALPKYERDYFTEFMKERDPDKQEEILQMVSPFLRRALKQVWGMNYKDEKGPDNEEYFQNHNLPNFLWEGWNPDSDLNKIKAKTIKNEGMLFSDFGIYESTYRDQEVINAPNLKPNGTQDPITLQANLQATLNGMGLVGVEVSVEPKSTKGIDAVMNLTKVVHYKLGNTINDLFS